MDYVEEFELNEYSGALHLTVRFSEGLNIIGGENGTGKTTLIRRLKESVNGGMAKIHWADPTRPSVIRVFALSPKRNAERQAYDQLVARLRQQNRTYANLVADLTSRAINDATFEAYPQIGEAFYFHYENATRDGGSQIDGMNLVVAEFNSILQRVFPNYRISANWDVASRSPVPSVEVDNRDGLRLDALSLGQREVLSLMFNIYTTRNDCDLVLIDEPELHLNWTLERGLFEFFDWFCTEYNKQMIVTTHSRVAFEKSFLPLTQFLVWNGNAVECTRKPTNSQRVAMAGEIAASIVAAAPQLTTFYVEDERHTQVTGALAKARGRAITTIACGRSEVVKTMFKFARGQVGWDQNAFFMVDGDNQGNSFPGQAHFVHLDRYCIECYLFDMRALEHMTGKAEVALQQDLLTAVKARSAAIFKTGKGGGFGQRLLDRARVEDLTPELLADLDCSEILDEFAKLELLPVNRYIQKYVASAKVLGIIEHVFDPRLVAAIDLGQLESDPEINLVNRYFAYGSNMNASQMAERCPDSRFLTKARLPGYRLDFTTYSTSRDGGAADIVAEDGAELWGIVYEVSDADLTELDRREGSKYRRIAVQVQPPGQDELPTSAYEVMNKQEFQQPTQDYLQLLIDAARHHDFPDTYVRQIEAARRLPNSVNKPDPAAPFDA